MFVLIPDKYGLAVCAVGDLYHALGDNENLAEAITNSAIDSVSDIPTAIEKVRRCAQRDRRCRRGLGQLVSPLASWVLIFAVIVVGVIIAFAIAHLLDYLDR